MTRSTRLSSRGIDKYGDIDLKAVNKAATSEDLKDEAEADNVRGDQAPDREAEGCAGRQSEGCTGFGAAGGQPFLHRF